MNLIFDLCVQALYFIADFFSISYKEVNVWIFVIIQPLAFVFMIITILKQRRKIKGKKEELQKLTIK